MSKKLTDEQLKSVTGGIQIGGIPTAASYSRVGLTGTGNSTENEKASLTYGGQKIIAKNWDEMEKRWEHCFGNDLHDQPK